MPLPRLGFEPEHEMFRDSVSRFMQAEFTPQVPRWRAQGHVDHDAFRKMGEQGYLLMWADPEYGGAGVRDLRMEQILVEESVRHVDIGFFHNAHSMLVGPYLDRLATQEQKARFLPEAISGETVLAIAMTEPDTGSDLAAIRTRAVDMGDHWLLNGSKTFISNGFLAGLAVVAAKTGDGSREVGLFVVEDGMAGFERGRKLEKIGLPAQDTAELFFNDVKVPKENVLGDPAMGFSYLGECLAIERLMSAFNSIAHAQAAFDVTLDYVKTRRAFGRPIGAFQNTRFRLAELRSELDAAQTYVDHCAMLGNEDRLSPEDAASAKLLTSELEGRVVDAGVQFHGGAGFMSEHRIARMYCDARVSRIYAGTSEIMKEIIGRNLGLDERRMN